MTSGGPISERSRGAADAIYTGARGSQQYAKRADDAEAGASFPEALSKLANAQEREPARPAPASWDRLSRANTRWHQGQTAIESSSGIPTAGEPIPVDAGIDQSMSSLPTPDAESGSLVQPMTHPCGDFVAACGDVAFLAALAGTSPPMASNANGQPAAATARATANIVSGIGQEAPSDAVAIADETAFGVLPEGMLRAVIVLRKETHLASAAPLPAAAQVAAGVSAELENGDAPPEAESSLISFETPTPSLPNPRDRIPSAAEIDMRTARAREALSNLKSAEAPSTKTPGDGIAVSAARKEPMLPSDLPAAPVQQIARQIADSGTVDSPPRSDTSSPFARIAPAPTKVLYIQLQPAELGTVTVRMALKNDALELHLEVSRQETARMINSDRETLTKILQSAGYMIDGVTLHVSKSDQVVLPAGGSSLPFSPSFHAGSQPDWSQPDARSPGNRGNDSGSSSSQDANSGDRNDKKRDADRLGGDLYV